MTSRAPKRSRELIKDGKKIKRRITPCSNCAICQENMECLQEVFEPIEVVWLVTSFLYSEGWMEKKHLYRGPKKVVFYDWQHEYVSPDLYFEAFFWSHQQDCSMVDLMVAKATTPRILGCKVCVADGIRWWWPERQKRLALLHKDCLYKLGCYPIEGPYTTI